MGPRFSRTIFCLLLVLGLGCAGLPAATSQAASGDPQGSKQAQKQRTLTAREAAARAKAMHGGKVLKVVPKGDAYRVKLLKDSGRVVTVTVKD